LKAIIKIGCFVDAFTISLGFYYAHRLPLVASPHAEAASHEWDSDGDDG